MRPFPFVLAAACLACTVQGGKDVPPAVGSAPVVVDPQTQTVSVDQSKVPVLDACADGSFVKRSGDKWTCAVPASVTYQAGTGLVLGNDTFSLPTDCASSQVLRWDLALGWVCSNAGTTDYQAGAGLRLTGNTFSMPACAASQVLRFDGAGWACSGAGTTDYVAGDGLALAGNSISLRSTGCQPGWSPRWTGSAWACTEIVEAPLQPIQVPRPNAASRLASGTASVQAGIGVAITVGANGFPLVSWFEASTNRVQVSACLDLSCQGFVTSQMAQLTGQVGNTSIAIGTDLLPIVAFGDGSTGEVRVAHCQDRQCRASTVALVEATGGAPGMVSLTVGTDGLPLVTYRRTTGANAYQQQVAHCDDPACTSSTSQMVDDSGHDGNASSVAIGADGKPVIAYYQEADQTLHVARCGDILCTEALTTRTLIPGAMGLNPSLTIGADGMPVISCFNWYSGQLWIVKCGNAGCSTGNTSTTISVSSASGPAYTISSITVAPDGLPVVAYCDLAGKNVNLLKCGNAACTSGNVTRSIGTSSEGVEWAAVTIGVDGSPIVAATTTSPIQGLDVFHCTNPFCVPNWTRR